MTQDLDRLLSIFPSDFQKMLGEHPSVSELIEVILDLGMSPMLRFLDGDEVLEEAALVSQNLIDDIQSQLTAFNSDNRAGIDGTLHRISAIRNRHNTVIGLTIRVGRAVQGVIEDMMDVLGMGKSILLLGPPGVGKTTRLREVARLLSTDYGKRVMIVDTSNEIAGEGDVPHSAVGRSRRLQVLDSEHQAKAMIEAVENHMPEVIVVDEIGTEAKALAARSIAERGVLLVATAHGSTLENLIKNPTISDLIGGVHSVILGDDEARFRDSQKTVLERKALPTFPVLVELHARDSIAIYSDTKASVDQYLAGDVLHPERRIADGSAQAVPEMTMLERSSTYSDSQESGIVSIFPFGLNVGKLTGAIHALSAPAQVSHSISQADIVLTAKSQMGSKTKLSRILDGREMPVHVIKRNAYGHMVDFLRYFFKLSESDDDVLLEAEREIKAISTKVMSERQVLEASPRPSFIRKRQHQLVEELGLNSLSVGEEPNRRVRVFPRG